MSENFGPDRWCIIQLDGVAPTGDGVDYTFDSETGFLVCQKPGSWNVRYQDISGGAQATPIYGDPIDIPGMMLDTASPGVADLDLSGSSVTGPLTWDDSDISEISILNLDVEGDILAPITGNTSFVNIKGDVAGAVLANVTGRLFGLWVHAYLGNNAIIEGHLPDQAPCPGSLLTIHEDISAGCSIRLHGEDNCTGIVLGGALRGSLEWISDGTGVASSASVSIEGGVSETGSISVAGDIRSPIIASGSTGSSMGMRGSIACRELGAEIGVSGNLTGTIECANVGSTYRVLSVSGNMSGAFTCEGGLPSWGHEFNINGDLSGPITLSAAGGTTPSDVVSARLYVDNIRDGGSWHVASRYVPTSWDDYNWAGTVVVWGDVDPGGQILIPFGGNGTIRIGAHYSLGGDMNGLIQYATELGAVEHGSIRVEDSPGNRGNVGGTITVGLGLPSSAGLTIEGDLLAGSIIEVGRGDVERFEVHRAIHQGATADIKGDILGGFNAEVLFGQVSVGGSWLDDSVFSVIAGSILIAGNLEGNWQVGSIAPGGQLIVNAYGEGAGSLSGDVAVTGDMAGAISVLKDSPSSGRISGSLTVGGDLAGSVSTGNDVQGVIDVAGDLIGDIAIDGDLFEYGSISVHGDGVSSGSVLATGFLAGDLLFSSPDGQMDGDIWADADDSGDGGGDIAGTVAVNGTFGGDICGDNLIGLGLGSLPSNISIAAFGPTASVCSEVGPLMGDFDDNGAIDLADFAAFQGCFSDDWTVAGFVPPVERCLDVFDIDGQGDVDLADWSVIYAGFITPRIAYLDLG